MTYQTPETDKEQREGLIRGNPIPTQVVHVNLPRRLERERDDARKAAKEALELLQRAVNDSAGRHHYAVSEAIAKLQSLDTL